MKEFPGFRIVQKADSFFMKLVYVLLLIITFGAQRTFMKSYTTTIGQTIFVPSQWASWPETQRLRILRHERVHLLQQNKYGRFVFSFLYLFCPLPLGLAYYRAKFEKEAYEETLRAIYEEGGAAALLDPARKKAMISYFTTGAYGWMWPFPKSMERWYDATANKICNSSPLS